MCKSKSTNLMTSFIIHIRLQTTMKNLRLLTLLQSKTVSCCFVFCLSLLCNMLIKVMLFLRAYLSMREIRRLIRLFCHCFNGSFMLTKRRTDRQLFRTSCCRTFLRQLRCCQRHFRSKYLRTLSRHSIRKDFTF